MNNTKLSKNNLLKNIRTVEKKGVFSSDFTSIKNMVVSVSVFYGILYSKKIEIKKHGKQGQLGSKHHFEALSALKAIDNKKLEGLMVDVEVLLDSNKKTILSVEGEDIFKKAKKMQLLVSRFFR